MRKKEGKKSPRPAHAAAELELLAKHVPDLIYRYRLTPQRGFEYVSPAATAITGYTPEEHYADPDLGFKIVHPEDRPLLEALAKSPASHAGPLVLRWMRKDGRVIWTEQRNVAIRDRAGNVVAIEGIARDITQRKRAEAALAESAERLARIVSSVDEIVYEVETHGDPFRGDVVFVSPRTRIMLGYGPEEFTDNPGLWFSLVHPDDVPEVTMRTRELHERKVPVTRLYRLKHKTKGQYRWMADRVAPRLDAAGRVTGYYGAARDLTEHKAADDLLQLQANILRNVRDGVIVTDLEGRITHWNEGATAVFGYTRDEMLGKTPVVLYPNQDPAKLAADLVQILQGTDYIGEWQGRRKDGREVWVDIKTTAIHGVEGKPVGFLGVSRDTTERKRTMERLELLESVIVNSNDAVLITAADRVAKPGPAILYVNEAFTRMTGYAAEEVVGRSPRFLQGQGTDRAERDRVRRALAQGEPARTELVNYRKDGSAFWTDISIFPVRDADGRIVRWASVQRDVSQRKHVEETIRASREQLRALTAQLQSVREEEQARMAREMHDQLGQALTALRIDVAWLEERLGRSDPVIAQRCGSMAVLLGSTIDAVRDLTTRLRPPVLDDLGLAAAVEWQAEDFAQRAGITCHVSLPDGELALTPERATAAFRVLQEALTNVARHAEAKSVEVSLAAERGTLVLRIADDGRGVSDEELSSVRSVGLIGMRERAAAFGGGVEIGRGATGGTVIQFRLPLGAGDGDLP